MMEILDPTTEAATQQAIAYAPRPRSLQGKRVALVENTKFNSDKLMLKIGDILKSEYGVAETRLFRKHNSSVPAHDEIIEEMKKTSDLMVAGVGD
jgi:hypothetical protein